MTISFVMLGKINGVICTANDKDFIVAFNTGSTYNPARPYKQKIKGYKL